MHQRMSQEPEVKTVEEPADKLITLKPLNITCYILMTKRDLLLTLKTFFCSIMRTRSINHDYSKALVFAH